MSLYNDGQPKGIGTSSENLLQIDFKRTEIAKNLCSTRAVKLWNSPPINVKTAVNLNIFIRRLESHAIFKKMIQHRTPPK